MNIVVCVKQVPDTTDIKWTESNTIQREGVESVMNPYDVWALEAALKIKTQIPDSKITVLTMGPNQAISMLKKAIALGADDAVLLSDKKFAGADTFATGKTLAKAISTKLPDTDLIICGQFAIDGDTAQTGPCIATNLNLPQVTFVKEIFAENETTLQLTREVENGLETVSVRMPAVICVLKKDDEPSRAFIDGIIKAQEFEVKVYSHEDIDLSPEDCGIKGSPTYVSKAFRPETKKECTFIDSIDSLIAEIGGANG